MGKAMLAYLEPDALRPVLDRTDVARRGPKTITDREQLMAALAQVRQTGIAVNDEELAAVNIAVHLTVWGLRWNKSRLVSATEISVRRNGTSR